MMFLPYVRYRIISLIFLLLTACSPAPKLPHLAPDAVILAYGDSLTYGTGADANHSYPAILARLTGHEVINAGVPGETSAQGLARLSSVLDKTQPSLMLLCHGGNDMLRQLDLQQTADNLKAMIREAQQRGIAVVLIGVPRPGLLLSTADLYETVATEMHVPLEDEVVGKILRQRRLKSDQVHPNAAGYKVMADAILSLLKKQGAL